MAYLDFFIFGVDFFCELGQRALGLEDEVVGVILVINAADDVQNCAA